MEAAEILSESDLVHIFIPSEENVDYEGTYRAPPPSLFLKKRSLTYVLTPPSFEMKFLLN